jgi:hypothetical protein
MTREGTRRKLVALWSTLGVALLIVVIAIIFYYTKPITLRGAVIKQDEDARRQSPIADVEVSVDSGMAVPSVKSDFSGYFKLTLPRRILPGRAITLSFRHPDYRPLDLKESVGDKLYVVHMIPIHQEETVQSSRPAIAVSNVFVRYSIETATTQNIGTGLKTFQVESTGNVRCDNHPPCSPDGRWKGSVATASLDAGDGNSYENARLSCIAGPCPFTKIVSDNFSRGGRNIAVSVLGWSDTTTFLFQAEVFRHQISDIVRESYPVIFGDSLNFTLPGAAEGASLEAEINGTHIVFPLRPSPTLSWASCKVRVGRDQSKIYRCELKAGYRFR